MSELTIEIGRFLALVISLVGIFWGMSRRQASIFERHIDTKFQALSDNLERIDNDQKKNTGQIAQVERDLMSLRAELPEKYVRREDYIRGQSLIESKLDGLAVKLENVQLKEAKRDRP